MTSVTTSVHIRRVTEVVRFMRSDLRKGTSVMVTEVTSVIEGLTSVMSVMITEVDKGRSEYIFTPTSVIP